MQSGCLLQRSHNLNLEIDKDDVTAGTYSGSVEMAWGLVDSGT